MEYPLRAELWTCHVCGTTEDTRHCLADFLAYCQGHWPCSCAQPQRESEVA